MNALARSTLIGLCLCTTPAFGSTCDSIPEGYIDLFLDAVDGLEAQVQEAIERINAISLPPLARSLLPSDILDLDTDVFEDLFGNSTERREALTDTLEDFDIFQELVDNANDLIGLENGELGIECAFNETAEKYTFDVTLVGSVPDLSPGDPLTPSAWLLPNEFPSLDLTVSTFRVGYQLRLPLALYKKLNKFILGETMVTFDIEFVADAAKDLAILEDETTVNFDGSLWLNVTFDYSSISKLSFEGSLSASLDASTSTGTATPNLSLEAVDAKIFDGEPRESPGIFYFPPFRFPFPSSIPSDIVQLVVHLRSIGPFLV